MINYIDVFNGDADGICSLIQLRNANPKNSELVTGIKRDIQLLKRVNASPDDFISVLDISFEKNSIDVQRLLDQGATIVYYDHHRIGMPVRHSGLKTFIDDQSSTVCTGLLVDKQLDGRFRAWALVAAFGDNLNSVAMELGITSGFKHESLILLKKLGIYINYNSYGDSLSDLFYHPKVLYQHLQQYVSPFDFIHENSLVYTTLEEGYMQDMAAAESSPYLYQSSESAIVSFNNEKWARRVSGVYINDLANQYPERAHATITENADGTYKVSIRSPLDKERSAVELAGKFETGGGRKSAAGINVLPNESMNQFIDAFKAHFS